MLPGFTVVAEKAEYVPTPATVPITPTRRSDRSAFRPRLMRWILLMVPSLSGSSRSVLPSGFGRAARAARPTPAEAIYWFCASHVKLWRPEVKPIAAELFCSVSVNR